uniref:Uncharacterized protein n=1 Tax=Ascaris lumbricoides TaxID=6252 RepID=A0A0M3IJM8_ASCLU
MMKSKLPVTAKMTTMFVFDKVIFVCKGLKNNQYSFKKTTFTTRLSSGDQFRQWQQIRYYNTEIDHQWLTLFLVGGGERR